MSRTGKCPNYAGCLLAFRNEIITVNDGQPFICPECARILMDVNDPMRKPVPIQGIILGGLSLLIVMASAAVWYRAAHLKQDAVNGQIGSSFEQAELAASRAELLPSRHLPAAGAPTPIPDDPEAPVGVYGYKAPAQTTPTPLSGVHGEVPALNPADPQAQQIRNAVLKQLALTDATPAITLPLERATRIGRILVIPFPPGHVALNPNDVQPMRSAIDDPNLQSLLASPHSILLVLGFANINGNVNTNLHISSLRAQAVANVLHQQCDLNNPLTALGMGASTLFGNDNDTGRNQSVEVWIALP